MNAELNDRIARLASRAAALGMSASVSAASVAGAMKLGARWGRQDEQRREAEKAQADARALVGVLGALVEILDGETVEVANG